MKEFALIFHQTKAAASTKPSPQQIQERMNWLAGIAAAGKLASKGNTLSATEAKTVRGDGVITDGPFTEIKEFISGFVIVKTDTMEDAVSLAKANPVLKSGGIMEIREVIQVYAEQQP